MSLEYAERRIREALKQAGGNITRARQQVIAWTFEDAKLLHALTKNHLNGIVAYHIDRVQSGRAEKPVDPPPAKPKKATKANNDDRFGMEILKAVVNSGEVFGLESSTATRHRGKASQQHVNAIHQIVEKSKSKPKKK